VVVGGGVDGGLWWQTWAVFVYVGVDFRQLFCVCFDLFQICV